jgi:hypothetical protein
VTSVINSTTFTTGLRSSNKTYYWRVQGLSSSENGEWSRTGTFKTDVPVPSIINASATPSPVTQGSTLTIASILSGLLPSNYSVKLNDNGNLYVMIGSGTNYSLSQSPSIIGSRNYSVGVYDINNNLKSSLYNGSYDVKKPNTAPTLNLISGNATATTGTNYTVQLQGNDADNNLSQITINWGDGLSNSQNAANGSVATFTHTYATANSYTWSATAYDSVNATSDNLAKTVTVSSPIIIPSISSASASPTSTTLGNSINFSATLSGNLPSGYSVKLSYGNTSISMSGSGTNYSVVQTPILLGQQVFTVGVYDANNNLKGNTFTSNFEIVKANTVPTLSFISGNTTATAGTSYSVQLQASDADNNLKSITVVWGDGTTDTQNATNGTTLTFTHTYATANTYIWSASALDSGNATSIAIAKSVNVSAAVVTPPLSTSGYTKISNSGATLPDTAVLGSGSNDWACTKDNKTGLTWEVKTDDGGLRDKDWKYSWYEPDSINNGGFAGYQNGNGHPEWCSGSNCDSYAYKNSVNKQTVCGAANWRMPTKDELMKLVLCSDGQYDSYGNCINSNYVVRPTINSKYFPNTGYWYWTSSTITDNSRDIWYVYFGEGWASNSSKVNEGFIRLVHDDTSISAKFNDTGITTCSNATTNNLPCPVSGFSTQDAQSGRDVTNNDDSDGHAGFSFTKISSTGSSLPASATSWNCVKDNVTGLIWEIKTTDGGLHDQKYTYTWFEPDSTKNGGSAGTQNGGTCNGSQCDTNAYVGAVNAVGYCGYKDWRMPTTEELFSIVSLERYNPSVDTSYFPNTQQSWFWASSTLVTYSFNAWRVDFSNGGTGVNENQNSHYVRLVR